jgi:hypothetical protein
MSIEYSFNKFGCDKSLKHQYHLFYDKLFSKYESPKILEIGVFEGNSTAAFLDYLPECEIYGFDIFERVSIEKVRQRFNTKRVNFFQCNSKKAIEVHEIMKPLNVKFDIIIDDAEHTPLANRLTLKNFIPYLADNGTYMIEDFWPLDKMNSKELQHPWLLKKASEYSIIEYKKLLEEIEKLENEKSFFSEYFDNRKLTKIPDSYIVSLSKK